ncbi:unnamed protein product [marine sediment metagenome]|uniref:Uncharacterized protein n=1 Tax=marine sediment metagenome TaxID=412755 RepID=X1JF00_9ZZZZ
MAKTTAVAKRRRNPPAKRRRYRSSGIKIPLGIVAGFAPYVIDLKKGYDADGFQGMGMYGIRSLTGYDYIGHEWHFADMSFGLFPILMGMGIHKFIGGTLGINRALGRAKIPLIRI